MCDRWGLGEGDVNLYVIFVYIFKIILICRLFKNF